jgi:hypothetical protein
MRSSRMHSNHYASERYRALYASKTAIAFALEDGDADLREDQRRPAWRT